MFVTRPSVVNGLNTDQVQIVSPGVYSITTRTTMVMPSALVVTATQSGSTSSTFTSPTTSPLSLDTQLTGQFNCAAGDIITVTVSSSAPADQPPSLIQTVINLRQGV